MDGLGNLDSFIDGCDATKMGAFLDLVQRRFSEAQAQKQKRVEGFVLGFHDEMLVHAARKKAQLEEHITKTIKSLKNKRDNAAAELSQSLEHARAKKQALILSFDKQEKACQEVETEMGEVTKYFAARQLAMERKQKQALRQFFEVAVQKISKEQNATCAAVTEGESEKQQIAQMLIQLLLAHAGPDAVALLASVHPKVGQNEP